MKDTFAEDWSREWDEVTKELNPKKGRELELTDIERAYREGSSDVWGIAKKLALCIKDGGYNSQEMMVIFNTDNPEIAFKKYTAQEVLERVRKYEKEQGTSKEDKEIEHLRSLRVHYKSRQQAFFEQGKFDMSNRYINKIKEIDSMIKVLQGDGSR